MKKILIPMLSLLAILATSTTVFAADFSGNATIELSEITEELIAEVNSLYADVLKTEVTVSDIDYGKAYKIYVDTNVFELSTNSVVDIKNRLESGTYIYLLPITVGDMTVVANFQKGQPLREDATDIFAEEEIIEVTKNIGKWTASVFTLYSASDNRIDYSSSICVALGKIPDNIVLVGGLPFFREVVALIPGEDGTIKEIIPFGLGVYDENAINHAEVSSGVYDYLKTKEFVNNLPLDDPNVAGGNNGIDVNVTISQVGNRQYIITGLIISFIIVVGTITIVKRHSKQ